MNARNCSCKVTYGTIFLSALVQLKRTFCFYKVLGTVANEIVMLLPSNRALSTDACLATGQRHQKHQGEPRQQKRGWHGNTPKSPEYQRESRQYLYRK